MAIQPMQLRIKDKSLLYGNAVLFLRHTPSQETISVVNKIISLAKHEGAEEVKQAIRANRAEFRKLIGE